MKLYRLHREQILPINIRQAWDFFADPANLPLITPPDLGLQITSTLPDRMYAGMIVSYTVTPFAAVPVAWVTEITHVMEPDFFVDEQRFGPYRFWHHQHLFREIDTGTVMTDLVHYGLPCGFLGRLAAFWVARRLSAIFEYRREALVKMFGE
jgi:ligand-binding SRPBCC domain-containing protein